MRWCCGGKHSTTLLAGFWVTVLKVEIADIAFAVDSILAAVALAIALPPTGLGTIGGMDSGQFMVILTGGLIDEYLYVLHVVDSFDISLVVPPSIY